MINQREDITDYLGRALFVVLFFLLMVAFSDQSVKQTSEPVSVQLVADLHANSVIADAIQLPSFQKSWVSVDDKTSFQLFNANFKRFTDNRTITQRFISLRRTELLIKPATYYRFYYHLFPKNTDEVPILG